MEQLQNVNVLKVYKCFFCLKYNKQIIFYHSKLIIIAKHVLNAFLIV